MKTDFPFIIITIIIISLFIFIFENLKNAHFPSVLG